MARQICFISKDGRSGVCINYGNRGDCESCRVPDKMDEEELSYCAWKEEG